MENHTGRTPLQQLPTVRVVDDAQLKTHVVSYVGGPGPNAITTSGGGKTTHLDLTDGYFDITLEVDGRSFARTGDWGWHTLGPIMKDMAASGYQVHCCLTCTHYERSRMVDEWSLGAEGYCVAIGEPDMDNLTHMLHGCGRWTERGDSESWFGREFTRGLTPEIHEMNSVKKGGTVSYETGHKLSDEFMHDLQTGILSPIWRRVQGDHTLLLEIRHEYISIYYRGGTLTEIARQSDGSYEERFNEGYCGTSSDDTPSVKHTTRITEASQVDVLVQQLAARKQSMDLFFSRRIAGEREVQQAVVLANNRGKLGHATDYYFCDVEYKTTAGDEFDMIGVRWLSTSAARRRCDGHRLVLAELKHGDGAIAGEASLSRHVEDINRFLEEPERVRSLKAEMILVFNQQRQLGLIDCDKDLVGFSDEPPLLLLLLSDHDPAKGQLKNELDSLDDSLTANLRFATASFMGYGIFEEGILKKKQLYKRCGWND